jgi:hypothetical protein
METVVNGWESPIAIRDKWHILKEPRWAGHEQPWQLRPPKSLYNNMTFDIRTFKTGADALAFYLTFNGGTPHEAH